MPDKKDRIDIHAYLAEMEDIPGTRVTPDGVLLGGLERAFGGPVAELR